MNNNQFKGHLKEVEGELEKITGKIVVNKTFEEKGEHQQVIGKVEADLGDTEEEIKKPN